MSNTLFDRLGGTEGIARLVDDAIAAHLTNPLVKSRFENVKDMAHTKKMAREFFAAGSGGPGAYSGRDMLSTHKGMNISEQEYLATIDDILGAMKKNELAAEVQNEVLAILYSLKGDIIRV